jgi:methyltransferase
VALAAIVYVPMLIEARRAARNERAQRARGGVEPSGDVYQLMRLAYPAAFAAMIGEAVIRGFPPTSIAAAGATVFAAGKALKWWAIATLGPFWTFRVIVVPGTALVTAGPYRWMRHPNYVGVMGELAGVSLMAGARLAGPVAILGFGLLLIARIGIEERTIRDR